ncbi:glycosyltransferase [Schleiferiaceae bacterium]|nr:glycosyltransferase [Schleiferiaceae bacterium]
MNILQVTNLFRSAKLFIGGQFFYLKEHGANMHLVCSDDKGLEKFALEQKIKSYKAVEIKRQISILSDIVALVKICLFIKRNDINVIVGHQAKGRLLTVLAGKIMRIPKIIIFAHGAIYETATGFKRWILILESKFESLCSTKVVCVSNYVANLRLGEGIDYKRKQIILGKGTCGGIDTQGKFNPDLIRKTERATLMRSLQINNNEFVIGFCGRIVRDKGIIELIDAFDLLKKKYPKADIKVLIVGDFEARDSLPIRYIHRILSDSNIIFTGWITYHIELYYSLMSVYVLPSYREGFGMSLIEASSMQIPVIANRNTGCNEALIDCHTGYHVDVTQESICENLEKLLNEQLRIEMGKNGRRWVAENFDHSVIWPEVVKLLQD